MYLLCVFIQYLVLSELKRHDDYLLTIRYNLSNNKTKEENELREDVEKCK